MAGIYFRSKVIGLYYNGFFGAFQHQDSFFPLDIITCHFLKNIKFMFGSGEFGNLIWDNGLSRREVVLYLSRHYLWARYIVAR